MRLGTLGTYCTILGCAQAQCPDSSVLVTSQEDADKLSTCSTINGGLQISSNIAASSLILTGVQTVNGNLTIGAAATDNLFTTIVMPSLVTVADGITVTSSPNLNNLSLPLLTTAGALGVSGVVPAFNSRGLVSIPSIMNITTAYISTSVGAFCAPWNNLKCLGAIGAMYSCEGQGSTIKASGDVSYCDGEYPTDGSESASSKYDRRIRLGAGLGLGLGIPAFLAVVAYFMYRQDQKERALWKKAQEEPDERELEPVPTVPTVPPPATAQQPEIARVV